MQYILLFLEGVITFISPCMLPLLPVYISFFAGGSEEENPSVRKTFLHASGFVIGFSIVFVALGGFAGSLGELLQRHKTVLNIVTGFIVVIFGLNYLGVLKIFFLNKTVKLNETIKKINFFSAILFGMIFSVGWSPCVGAFLGSALILASQGNSALTGCLMLLVFSSGLGIPFIVSALLIHRLKKTIGFLKKHYTIINMISGLLLIIVGILIMTGTMGYFLSSLSF